MQQDDMSHVVRRRFVLRHQMDLLRTHLEDRIGAATRVRQNCTNMLVVVHFCACFEPWAASACCLASHGDDSNRDV